MMKQLVKEELRRFLQEYYPEVILLFANKGALSQYLEDRVILVEPLIDELLEQDLDSDLIAEITVGEITSSFGPSRFHFLKVVLLEEYPEEYHHYESIGVLRFELTNMIVACSNAFDAFDFSKENLDDPFMRHMIIAEIHDYLHSRSQN